MTVALGGSSGSGSQLGIWTLIADGHGGFVPTTPAPIPLPGNDPSAPSAITLADLDGDGFPDAVIGRSTTGTVLIAYNDGTGTMRPSAKAAPDVGVRAGAVLPGVSAQAFADFNDDGQLDFVTLTSGGAEVFLGQSGGGFTPGQFLPAAGATFVKVADVNGDGIPDIVLGNGNLVVYLGNGDGTFRPAPASPVAAPAGYSIENVTLADVNNDGHLDAVATMQSNGNGIGTMYFAVFFGDGQGGFEFNPNTVIPLQFGLAGLIVDDTIPQIAATLGDFNGDGKLDLLVPTESGGVYSLTDYLGNGNGTFTPGPVVYSGTGAAYDELLVGDLTGDGTLDIVGFNGGASPTADVYLGDGKGGFQQSASVDLSKGTDAVGNTIFPADLALGDFNGDGHLDLAVSYYDFFANPTEVDIFTGDGAGHFAAAQSVTVGMNPFTLVSIPRIPFLDAGTFAVTDEPPTANNSTTTAVSGLSVTIPVLDDATNPDGAPLTIEGLTAPAHGVAHIAGGPPSNPADEVIVYAPTVGFTGTDSFTYTIADPAGVESTGTVAVTVTAQSVNPSATSIAAVSGSGPFGGAAILTATLTASGSHLPGETIAFTLNEGGTVKTVGTATTDANGVATLTGVSVAGLNPDTYASAVGASFAGDSTYAASSASGTLVVSALAPPAVTGVSPAAGPTTGGTMVTITGSNLAGATAVDFGLTQVSSFISDTASQIVVSSPAGAGTVGVTVMTASGRSATSSAAEFSYFPSQALPTNLSAVSGSGTIGGTATLTSTLTASAVPLAGRTVIFTLTEGGTVRTVGTATTDANGVATSTGVSLAGLNAGTYSSAVGVSFAGDPTYAASSSSGTLVVNPTKAPHQSPPVIIGEQPLFRRKTSKKGKPIGRPVLSGFVFDFSDPINPTSATNGRNYQVDTITTKRVKKQTRRILHPITSFSVAYSAAKDSVTLTFAGKQTFRTGGQITVVGGPPSGITGASGAALAGNKAFTISPRGQSIVAQ